MSTPPRCCQLLGVGARLLSAAVRGAGQRDALRALLKRGALAAAGSGQRPAAPGSGGQRAACLSARIWGLSGPLIVADRATGHVRRAFQADHPASEGGLDSSGTGRIRNARTARTVEVY